MGSSARSTYKSLYQHLQKEFRSGVISLPDDREVLVQLIYSALLENRPAAAALDAFETIENSFIDWNELRVSTARELGELLPMLNDPLNSCERLRQTLQAIFQATYKFDLEEWREKGESAFRDYLETIRYVTPFMRNYTVAAVFHKGGVPLDEGAFRVLRLLDLVDVDEENREVPIGLERAFSKSDALEFAKLLHELGAMLMDASKHAVGMTLSNGVEILIHVGIDTVSMGGEGFSYLVKVGDVVRAGTPLLKFSKAAIQKAGHPDTAVFVVTNPNGVEFKFLSGMTGKSNETVIATY